jgi:hypothetical protein
MPAAQVVREVFQQIHDSWGDEDTGYVFDHGPGPITRVDVLAYRPTATLDMTSFVTVGMCTEPMPGPPGPASGGRAELQLARRGPLTAQDEHAIAVQLANLSAYPWAVGEQIGWGHMVGLNTDFPTMPGCDAVFLSGPMTPSGRDYFPTSEGAVRVINVVPITDVERTHARALPPLEFLQQLMARVDVFAPRNG